MMIVIYFLSFVFIYLFIFIMNNLIKLFFLKRKDKYPNYLELNDMIYFKFVFYFIILLFY